MDTWIYLVVLALLTVMAGVWLSKRRTGKKLDGPTRPKASRVEDGPGPNPATAPRAAHVRHRPDTPPTTSDRN